MADIDYSKVCFVIMPFGEKTVELPATAKGSKKKTVTKTIDFDEIFKNVFARAIRTVKLPEGGKLIPRRVDKDFFTAHISTEMHLYLEYSRFAVADITGLNPNVFYELGHRLRAQSSGTAVFRLPNAPIPFDINQIKAFPYEYRPDSAASESRKLIAHVLTESLKYNRVDSPVRLALGALQRGGEEIEEILKKADFALRQQDWSATRQLYERAVALQPSNALLRFKVGLMWRQLGKWDKAAEGFAAAVEMSPKYAEAHRELGIAQNKLFGKGGAGPDGIASLEKAIELVPDDFDALSTLGGSLRRAGKLPEALERYRAATIASGGHPYPLLNELKLEAVVNGKTGIFAERNLQLRRAEQFRLGQTIQDPPMDAPWSFFDLAEIQLYLGRPDEFLATIDRGLLQPLTRAWEARTFRETLTFLADGLKQHGAPPIPGLDEGIRALASAEPQLLD